MTVIYQLVDYTNPKHGEDLLFLLNDYACDPMGGNEPLKDEVKATLVSKLAKTSFAFSVIAYVDGKPAGLANCFFGFSTFSAKSLVNLHDLVVVKAYRGMGISQGLLAEIEKVARKHDCCKVTLEVLEGNKIAQNSYVKFGFKGYELDPEMGKAMMWQKYL